MLSAPPPHPDREGSATGGKKASHSGKACVAIVARNRKGGTSSPSMGEDGGEGDLQ